MPIINNNCCSDLLTQHKIINNYKSSRTYCWPNKEKTKPKLRKNIENQVPLGSNNFIVNINKGENKDLFIKRKNKK